MATAFVLLAVAGYLLLAPHGTLLGQFDQLASVISAMASVVTLAIALKPEPAAVRGADEDDTKARRELAERVAASYQQRLDRLGGDTGRRLWLSWKSVDNDVTQYIAMRQPRARAGASGGLHALMLLFHDVPGRRLVICGPKGSGKTIFAIQLANALLATPEERTLPVVVQAVGWHPERRPLNDWLPDAILATYPDVEVTREAVARLVRRNEILPILDDFDELPPKLRLAALRAVPGGCLLVTHDVAWRDRAYPGWQTWRRVIQVQSISWRDGEEYLRGAAPSGPAAGSRVVALTKLLTTPLEYDLGLRRLRRLGWPEHDEQRTSRDCRAAIDSWLADEVLDTAYEETPDAHDRRTVDRHRSYLARLATVGESGPDGIAWWRLHHLLPQPLLRLAFGAVFALLGAGAWWALQGTSAAGTAAVLAGGAGVLLADPTPPRRFQLRQQWLAGAGWMIGATVGFCASQLLADGPVGQVVVVAGAAGLAAVALSIVDRPADPDRETCPRQLRRADAGAALGEAGALTVLLALAEIAAARSIGRPVNMAYLVLPLLAGIGWAVVRSACGWYLVTLAILAATHRLPVRLLAFLADARRRGLVRRVGACYELRYPFLAERLRGVVGGRHRRG
ncbi:hypothetical protein [Micromonospora sp. DT233]|uniref:hypothetical protein n=1 Tax=Micromonospora sp. DT233 TaxID=3393432 RepID=UPI003CF84892